MEPDSHRPDWVRDAVFYQIFPDRFARDDRPDPETTPPPGQGAAEGAGDGAGVAWDALPTRENFFGGTLAGITRHLGHLTDLGVNAIYLTPIFAADTNHRYDTTDYYRLDPRLGTDRDFDVFLAGCHERGIRVVLDAVFHHCGWGHWAFQDVVRNGPASAYADWFRIDSYPVRAEPTPTYATCSGCWYLPKLNVDNPELRAHLFGAVRQWTARGVDGWRLDVPYMMDNPGFWEQFRGVVREVNPEAYIVAEVWDFAGDWATATTSDAAMNYQLRAALLAFLVDRRTGADAFAADAARIASGVGDGADHMLNLLASHDTARLRTTCGGEPALSHLAVGLLLALRGIPMLYYGDEVGMTGFNDPECRATMPWHSSDWDQQTLAQVQQLVRIRRGSIALRRGSELVTPVTDDIVRVERRHPEQCVVVYGNRAATPATVTLTSGACDLLTRQHLPAGPLHLPGRGIRFLELVGES